MRAACIGLGLNDLDKIIAIGVQSGRITHHNPIGYLGSVVAGCFTYFALKKISPDAWAALLFEEVFPKAKIYVEKANRQVKENLSKSWDYFIESWKSYVKLRKLSLNSK